MNDSPSPHERARDAGAGTIDETDEISLLDLVIVLAAHKWLVLGLPFAAAVIAVIASLLMPNIYTATTRVILPLQGQASGAQILGQLGGSLPAMASGALSLKNPADLYLGMLKSRTIADELIARFNLGERYGAPIPSDVRNRLAGISRFSAGKDSIISVEVDDEDPKFAAVLANAYVESLIRLSNTLAVTEAGQRRLFLERQLQQARDDMIKAEVAARSALQQGGVAVVEEQGRAMVAVNTALRSQIAAKEVQISAMAGFASEHHPDVMKAQQELGALRQQLTKLEGYGGPETGEKSRKDNPQGLKNVALLRNFKISETLFNTLTRQYEIAKVEEAREGMVVQVLDAAVPPDRKTKPRRATIVIVSTLAAGVAAILLAFLSEALARGRRNPETSERLLRLRRYLRSR
jgi:uncharacterized protein involved in exopolysaccharide biosynthesis